MLHTCTKVTLRQREITNGRISLYLDYYPAVRHPETMIMSRREYLGINNYVSYEYIRVTQSVLVGE